MAKTSKDGPLEVAIRSALHRRGYRFRKHVKKLPGKPDLVFPKEKIAVFIDGDFWHGYDFDSWKHKLKEFWKSKIETNIARDERNFAQLQDMGWIVIRVWQHEIKKDLAGMSLNLSRSEVRSQRLRLLREAAKMSCYEPVSKVRTGDFPPGYKTQVQRIQEEAERAQRAEAAKQAQVAAQQQQQQQQEVENETIRREEAFLKSEYLKLSSVEQEKIDQQIRARVSKDKTPSSPMWQAMLVLVMLNYLQEQSAFDSAFEETAVEEMDDPHTTQTEVEMLDRKTPEEREDYIRRRLLADNALLDRFIADLGSDDKRLVDGRTQSRAREAGFTISSSSPSWQNAQRTAARDLIREGVLSVETRSYEDAA